MDPMPIIHIEIAAADPIVTARFYAAAFGWDIEPGPVRDSAQFQTPGGPGGAFVGVADHPHARSFQPRPGDMLLYLDTPDIEATLAAVERHGGAVIQPRTAIPGTGWYALFTDPAGTRMALYSASPAASSAPALSAPHASGVAANASTPEVAHAGVR